MANTTNFGWETPDDTDLVKDGALAMRTLGNAIDSSLVDLKGGTTGQILSKNSDTDLDYIWINNDQGDITGVTAGTGLTGGGTSGSVTLTNDMATTITAAGDIVIGTGNGTYDNLPIGTTGQVLTADTTVSPYKVKWAAAGGGGATWANYTPTWTNLTVGNGTNSGRYIQIEKVVFFNAYVLFGSTTSVSGGIEVSVPVTAGSTSALAMGNYTVMVVDDGVGNWFATVNTDRVNWTDTGKIRLIPWKANDTYVKFDTNFSSTVPFTWATNDRIMVAGYYEVA